MGTRLFVGNLSYGVTEQDLKEAFGTEGIDVRSVRVALDRESGRPRGFAFVETATDDGAKQSIEKLSGRILQGRPLIIEEAQARTAGAPRPGGPAAPGGPRPGFGAPRPAGAPAAGGAGGPRFGAARPEGAPPPRSFGGPPRPPPPFDPGRDRRTAEPPRRERPEKKRSSRPRPEERERGNWRWNGKVDED